MRTIARQLLIVVAVSCVLFAGMAAPGGEGSTMVYVSVGDSLAMYAVDGETATLTRRGSVMLPGYAQEAWHHPSKPMLYVAWSNGGPLYPPASGGAPPAATQSGITAFAIDPAKGLLRAVAEPTSLRARPIYLTSDINGTHLLVAYNQPSGLSVHQIRDDGQIGSEVEQPDRLDVGIYAHQIRVSPTNAAVILVTRGNEPARGTAEDPGAIKVFRYRDGLLTNLQSIAPNSGIGFRSRHIDFHPTRPWVFLTLEAQNKLDVFRRDEGEKLAPAPAFVRDTLASPAKPESRQATSSVHVHPNGRFVYVANRGAAGGENSIAVFSINGQTGEPTRIQNVDTNGIQPRTFAINTSGRILIVGNQTSRNLSVFRIASDGKLAFVRAYDIPGGDKPLLWVGMF